MSFVDLNCEPARFVEIFRYFVELYPTKFASSSARYTNFTWYPSNAYCIALLETRDEDLLKTISQRPFGLYIELSPRGLLGSEDFRESFLASRDLVEKYFFPDSSLAAIWKESSNHFYKDCINTPMEICYFAKFFGLDRDLIIRFNVDNSTANFLSNRLGFGSFNPLFFNLFAWRRLLYCKNKTNDVELLLTRDGSAS